MVGHPDEVAREHLAELRVDLGAKAAGYWWVARDWLEQIAFVASPALPDEVKRDFAEATRSVALDQTDLGIVRAVQDAAVVVSRVAELPADAGSGRWLRAFGATRSVAVPILDAKGAVHAVVSVALGDDELSDEQVAHRIETTAKSWVPPLSNRT